MRNPYKTEGPTLLCVSGGRTSGYMLRRVIDAHGGKLPSDVVATFQNTGLEHPATLNFVKEISERWSVPIVWLEYCLDAEGGHSYKEVTYCTAARNGEPFEALIGKRKMLPNVVSRFCTAELKSRTNIRWAKAQGWREWTKLIGLRYDEQRRAVRARARGGDIKGEELACPMYDAKDTLEDVQNFWSAQDFDLALPNNDDAFGNCVGCFLKSGPKLEKIARSNPGNLEWWAKQEERTDLLDSRGRQRFRKDRPTYRSMLTQITVQGQLFPDDYVEDDTLPCNCTD